MNYSSQQAFQMYKSDKHYYPQVIRNIDSHLNLYPDCQCEFWLPRGNKNAADFNNDDESRYYFQKREREACDNCHLVAYNCVSEEQLAKDLFIYEYTAFLLEVDIRENTIDLCKCCYNQFKQDFKELP